MSERLVQLREILALERIPVNVEPDKYYTQIGIRSFGRGIFRRSSVPGSELSKLLYFQVFPDRIIFSNIMAWEGAIGLSGQTEAGCIGSSRFLSYKAIGEVDLRYLNYLFQWPTGRRLIYEASTGSTVRNKTLSREALDRIRVPLPDITEQISIADSVDALLRRVAAAQMLHSRVSDLHTHLAESLITETSEAATESARIGEVLAFERAPIAIDPEATYRTLGIRSFGKGFIYHPPASGNDLSKLNYFRFDHGALALSNLMAWEGGITVTRQEDTGFIASNRFYFYVPTDDRTNVSYLRYFLLSRRGQALIASACSSGAERNRTLGRRRFEALEVPLPPRAEQNRVAQILDGLAERVSTVHGTGVLQSLQPSILNAAFTGQL